MAFVCPVEEEDSDMITKIQTKQRTDHADHPDHLEQVRDEAVCRQALRESPLCRNARRCAGPPSLEKVVSQASTYVSSCSSSRTST